MASESLPSLPFNPDPQPYTELVYLDQANVWSFPADNPYIFLLSSDFIGTGNLTNSGWI